MRVSVICVSDRPERLPCLYWSLVAQTHEDWLLVVLDQTGWSVGQHLPSDHGRVLYHSVRDRRDWGQTEKEKAVSWTASDALMFPADDAYYVPTALASMVESLEHNGTDIVLCGWLYDHLGYIPMPPQLAKGYVDVGGFMVRRETFLKTGWRDKGQTGDFTLLEDMVKAGAKISTVPNILYVKN